MIGTLLLCATLLAVDGDTIRCDGETMRDMRDMGDGAPFVSGYDAPEIGRHAKCGAEREMGGRAKRRLSELLRSPGARICDSGEVDRHGRPLIWVRLPGERSAGAVLLAEGLARPWPSYGGHDWC